MSVVSVVLWDRGRCDDLITHPEESYRLWCVVVCDLETSWMRKPWPSGGCCAPPSPPTKVFATLRFWLISVRVNSGIKYQLTTIRMSRSQWPRGLWRRSTAARLLRSWVRIPPGTWMFVYCVCRVLSVEVSATGWLLVQRSPTDCNVALCVI